MRTLKDILLEITGSWQKALCAAVARGDSDQVKALAEFYIGLLDRAQGLDPIENRNVYEQVMLGCDEAAEIWRQLTTIVGGNGIIVPFNTVRRRL